MSFNANFKFDYAFRLNAKSDYEWQVHGSIVDNSGNYFPTDSKVGDIIYIDSYSGPQRYVITEILSYRPEFIAKVKWEMIIGEPIEPQSGFQAVIGEPIGYYQLTDLTSWTINGLSESFINGIRNYELRLVENKTMISPEFQGTPTVPTPSEDSNNKQVVNTEWVNQKLETIRALCKGEFKEFIAGEKLDRFKLVYLNSENKIMLVNSNNLECLDSIVGVTTDVFEKDSMANVIMEGCITNEEWNFEDLGVLYAGLNGEMVKQPNEDCKFLQQVALILENNTINIEIEESILIG